MRVNARYSNERLNDVSTHLETYAEFERTIDEEAWIALVYDCTREQAKKMIEAARKWEADVKKVYGK